MLESRAFLDTEDACRNNGLLMALFILCSKTDQVWLLVARGTLQFDILIREDWGGDDRIQLSLLFAPHTCWAHISMT